MKILRNATTGEVIATVRVASGFFERLTGFMARKTIAPEEGIWFPSCGAVHTMGMLAAIDIVFLDAEDRVLRSLVAVKPGRLAVACSGANAVVELGDGALSRHDVLVGDRFRLE